MEPITPRPVPHMPIADADDAGRDAFTSGDPLSANPHTPGSREHAAWQTGWLGAEELQREFPADPVEDLLAEVRRDVQRKEAGLDVLLRRINDSALRHANFLTIGAPECVVEEHGRASLRRHVDALLERKPVFPRRSK